jgi:hypothetical protein
VRLINSLTVIITAEGFSRAKGALDTDLESSYHVSTYACKLNVNGYQIVRRMRHLTVLHYQLHCERKSHPILKTVACGLKEISSRVFSVTYVFDIGMYIKPLNGALYYTIIRRMFCIINRLNSNVTLLRLYTITELIVVTTTALY